MLYEVITNGPRPADRNPVHGPPAALTGTQARILPSAMPSNVTPIARTAAGPSIWQTAMTISAIVSPLWCTPADACEILANSAVSLNAY